MTDTNPLPDPKPPERRVTITESGIYMLTRPDGTQIWMRTLEAGTIVGVVAGTVLELARTQPSATREVAALKRKLDDLDVQRVDDATAHGQGGPHWYNRRSSLPGEDEDRIAEAMERHTAAGADRVEDMLAEQMRVNVGLIRENAELKRKLGRDG